MPELGGGEGIVNGYATVADGDGERTDSGGGRMTGIRLHCME